MGGAQAVKDPDVGPNGQNVMLYMGKPLKGLTITPTLVACAWDYMHGGKAPKVIDHQRVQAWLAAHEAVDGGVFDDYLKRLEGANDRP